MAAQPQGHTDAHSEGRVLGLQGVRLPADLCAVWEAESQGSLSCHSVLGLLYAHLCVKDSVCTDTGNGTHFRPWETLELHCSLKNWALCYPKAKRDFVQKKSACTRLHHTCPEAECGWIPRVLLSLASLHGPSDPHGHNEDLDSAYQPDPPVRQGWEA